MKYWIVITGAVWLILSLYSCDGNPPELNQAEWMLVDRADSSGTRMREELLLFCQGSDEDGSSDLASLTLRYPDLELSWTVDGEALSPLTRSSENWWGYPSLVMPRGENFPRGEYGIILEDLSGQRAERILLLEGDPFDPEEFDPPEFQASAEGIEILDARGRDWMILFYRDGMGIRREYVSSNALWTLPADLKVPGISCFLLHVDPRFLRGWKQGPYGL